MGLRSQLGSQPIPRAVVAVADGKFTVRGLSPNDALGLYYRHAGELSALFDQFSGRVKAGEDVNAVELGTSMVGGAPLIMAEIIAIASGSRPPNSQNRSVQTFAEDAWEDDVQIALDLPAGAQMDALTKISTLTFTSDMPLKKFFGLVLAMAQSTTAAFSNEQKA